MIGGRRSIILVGVARGFEDGFGKLDTGLFLLDGFADGLGSLVAWDDDFLMLEEFSSLEELKYWKMNNGLVAHTQCRDKRMHK